MKPALFGLDSSSFFWRKFHHDVVFVWDLVVDYVWYWIWCCTWLLKVFMRWNECTAMNELGTKITLSLCHRALWLLWWRMIILLVHLAKVLVKQEGLRYYVVSYLGTYLDGDRFRFTVILFWKLYIFDFVWSTWECRDMKWSKSKIKYFLTSILWRFFYKCDSILPKDNEPYPMINLKSDERRRRRRTTTDISISLYCTGPGYPRS